jgi:UDP-glucose 4-epimerase
VRIFVTGGAGYIGSHAVRLFLQRGHDVWVYDSLVNGHRAAVPADRLIVGDLADTDHLDRVFAEHRIEAVVHFAAFAYVGESMRQPGRYYLNNFINTLHFLEVMHRHQVSRIVFSSTCATYGIPPSLPITEDTPQQPINPYGKSKLAVERTLLDYAQTHHWQVALLRYFNAAGASPDGDIGEHHDPETHLIPLLIQAAQKQRGPVEIFGTDYPTPDGTCIRDYIHVNDLASAHLLALERLEPGRPICCNLGTGRGHSVREVIQTVEEVTGLPVPVKESPRRPGDPPELVASADRARSLLGWKPDYPDLRAIITTAWNWHRKHPKGYDD